MNKKKSIVISVIVLATMIVTAGTAFANGNQGATLEEKLIAIENRVDEESMTREEATTIIAEITSCDEECDESEECTNRPEEGRGIFGNGAKDGNGNGNGAKDGNGNGIGAKDGNGNGIGAKNGQNRE